MSGLDYNKLPSRLREALYERGHSESSIGQMSAVEAVSEYAAWHLGDGAWGRDFYMLVTQVLGARR